VVYIITDSVRLLLTGSHPASSPDGIALMVLSLIVMLLLARAKLCLLARLWSRALRADAHETIICAWLSATPLLGLGLNAVLGWCWGGSASCASDAAFDRARGDRGLARRTAAQGLTAVTGDPLNRSGRVSYMTPATTTPETKVSAAMAPIAKGMVKASAKSPAAIAPTA
jgi:hypothetical protein